MIKRVNFNYCSNFLNIASQNFFKNINNGHLVSVDSGTTARYFYDYEMRRRKAVYTDRTILFFYDLEGKLISELDLSSTNWKDYIYIDLEPIARIDQRQPWIKIGDSYLRADKTGGKVHLDWSLYNGSEAFRVYRSTNDFTFSNPQVIQELNLKTYDDDVLNDGNNYAYRIYKNVPTEGLYFYHCDHLMTPLQMTDENQNIVWQAEYYPFGRIYSQSGDIENNIRFPGQYSEPDLNIYYNWQRYYSAKIGRYFSGVKYLYLDEEGSYDYVLSNPVNKYDFDGNKIKPIGDVANEIYNRFKKCNKLFKGLAEQFEEDKKTYKIITRNRYGCMLTRLRSEGNVINIPFGKCEDQLECLFHEMYEEFLIRYAGFPKTQGGAGPADDKARAVERKFIYKECCECKN